MVYIDYFISKYRLSFPSTLRANPDLGAHLLFRAIQSMPLKQGTERYREQALRRISQGADLGATSSGDAKVLSWMLMSRFYRKHLFSGRTVLCLAALVSLPLATRIWLRRQGRSSASGSGRTTHAPRRGGAGGDGRRGSEDAEGASGS